MGDRGPLWVSYPPKKSLKKYLTRFLGCGIVRIVNKKYNSIAKQGARQEIWDKFAIYAKTGKALLLPNTHRSELDQALSLGFAPENLYLVDRSPAVLATLTRNLTGHERDVIHRRGSYLSTATREWAGQGVRLQCAHLDFCGKLSGFSSFSVLSEIENFARCGILEDGLVAITILKGREAPEITKHIQKLDRSGILLAALNRGENPARLLKSGTYKNEVSKSPMFWGIFRIKRRKP